MTKTDRDIACGYGKREKASGIGYCAYISSFYKNRSIGQRTLVAMHISLYERLLGKKRRSSYKQKKI
jgi:hypothetical protein